MTIASIKRVGTFVPLSALATLEDPDCPGTFSAGIPFLDWLYKTGQTAWQMLPLHQTSLIPGSRTRCGASPYKGYGIGIDPKYRSKKMSIANSDKTMERFRTAHADWLADVALFCALRDYFGTDDWPRWGPSICRHVPTSVLAWQKRLAGAVAVHEREQCALWMQYAALRRAAKKRRIALVGDLPFYLAHRSPLVWAHQELFDLRSDGQMPRMSGVLDGPSAHFGRQFWGHPLYQFSNPSKLADIEQLWTMRLRFLKGLFDLVRLDFAGGFLEYGSLDPADPEQDRLELGPGIPFLKHVLAAGAKIGIKLFAEDSGERLRPLRFALERLGVPGMKIFRYGLTTKGEEFIHPQYADVSKYPTKCVAYTTTHDTETLLGYLETLTPAQKRRLSGHAGVEFVEENRELAVRLRDAVIASPAKLVVIPIQDWLLTTDRINLPGTEQDQDDKNWHFRLATPIENLPMIR